MTERAKRILQWLPYVIGFLAGAYWSQPVMAFLGWRWVGR
jgi:hypothetical protein